MKRLLLSILIVCLLTIDYTTAKGAEWVHYGIDDMSIRLYNKGDIVSDGRGVIKVWEKIIYSKEGKAERISKRQRDGLNTVGYENLSHVVNLWAINCNNKEYGILFNIAYNTTNNVLDRTNYTDIMSWNPIPPESFIEGLYEEACKATKKK